MTSPIKSAWQRAWQPPDRRPIYTWASEHVVNPPVLTIDSNAEFDVSRSRWMIEVFEALQDDAVRSVTLLKPVRAGGSLIGDVWLAWIPPNDPGPTFAVFESDKQGKAFAEDRINWMLDHCEPTAALFPQDRHKRRTMEIKFTNGHPLYITGPSLANLQAKGIRYGRFEELWAWPAGLYQEALARMGDWEDIGMSKAFVISQAGYEDDALDREFKRGDQREWQTQCLHCGKFMAAPFSAKRPDGTRWGIVWSDDSQLEGQARVTRAMETVRFECLHCGHPHLDTARTKAEWNRTGKWEPQNPHAHRSNVSFHIEGVIARPWSWLVEKFLAAVECNQRGVIDDLRQFVQKHRALPWSELYDPSYKPIQTFDLSQPWPDEGYRCMTVDCQEESLYWVMVCAWSKTGTVRRLWYGKLFSEGELAAKQKEHKIPGPYVLIDSGYHAKHVYRMCIRAGGWIPTKGAPNRILRRRVFVKREGWKSVESSWTSFPGDPEEGTSSRFYRKIDGIRWSNPTIGDRLKTFLDRGLWSEPTRDARDANESEYQKQMAGQRRFLEVNKATGRTDRVWKKVGPDHAVDCARQQILWATIKGILPDLIAPEKLEKANA